VAAALRLVDDLESLHEPIQPRALLRLLNVAVRVDNGVCG
jgi:hypothetical protein